MGKSHLLAEFARRAHVRGAVVIDERDTVDGSEPRPDGSPLVIVWDDAPADRHDWIQAASRSGSAGVLVLVACSDQISAMSSDVREPFVSVRQLGPLSIADIAAVVSRIAGDQPPSLLDAVYIETGGVPELVVDMANRLREPAARQRV